MVVALDMSEVSDEIGRGVVAVVVFAVLSMVVEAEVVLLVELVPWLLSGTVLDL